MKIEHLAIWVKDLERSKEFYTTFFNTSCGEKYVNEKKQFSSYFLSFDEVAGEPRTTGDGYYESVVRDPDGNLVEITD